MLTEIPSLRASIPDGLRNLAHAIEQGEYEPKFLVWVLRDADDKLVCGELGLCSDADTHFLLAQGMRFLEGCYDVE